jgi:hypothetical protein
MKGKLPRSKMKAKNCHVVESKGKLPRSNNEGKIATFKNERKKIATL